MSIIKNIKPKEFLDSDFSSLCYIIEILDSNIKKTIKKIYPWLMRIDDLGVDFIYEQKKNSELSLRNKGYYRRFNYIRPLYKITKSGKNGEENIFSDKMLDLSEREELFNFEIDFYKQQKNDKDELLSGTGGQIYNLDKVNNKNKNKEKEDFIRNVVLPKIEPLTFFSLRMNRAFILDDTDYINIIIFRDVEKEFIQTVRIIIYI